MKKIIHMFFLGMVLATLVGCGENCKVTGKVTFPDGTPLTRGKVVFETTNYISKGQINKDGTYVLGTNNPKDGAPPGTYRVCFTDLINPTVTTTPSPKGGPPKIQMSKPESPIHHKYYDSQKSGLVCEVKGRTKFDIVVEPPE